jgi:hypothetical protein
MPTGRAPCSRHPSLGTRNGIHTSTLAEDGSLREVRCSQISLYSNTADKVYQASELAGYFPGGVLPACVAPKTTTFTPDGVFAASSPRPRPVNHALTKADQVEKLMLKNERLQKREKVRTDDAAVVVSRVAACLQRSKLHQCRCGSSVKTAMWFERHATLRSAEEPPKCAASGHRLLPRGAVCCMFSHTD